MEFEIVRAVPKDADELAVVMQAVTAGLEHPEWFMDDDAEYIRAHIGHAPVANEDCGFTLKAVTQLNGKEVIAGFFMAAFPGIGEKNLGHHLAMDEVHLARWRIWIPW